MQSRLLVNVVYNVNLDSFLSLSVGSGWSFELTSPQNSIMVLPHSADGVSIIPSRVSGLCGLSWIGI